MRFARYDEDAEPKLILSPVNFFELKLGAQFHKAKTLPGMTLSGGKAYKLPDLSALTGDDQFADVGIAWNEEGLILRFEVYKPFEAALYPEIQEGDSVEVFIDTRDVKTAGFATRFCHHFFFVAEEVDGKFGAEISRFRTDDSHPLSDHNDLIVKPKLAKDSYTLDVFIPQICLFGYEPADFKRIGFTYRINRCGGDPQHFSLKTDEFRIEDQPALWASITLQDGS